MELSPQSRVADPPTPMTRRDTIRMQDLEVQAFLEQQRTLVCATIGRDGRPHLMPLWYVLRDERLWSWTYARSQKVRNLERDARATLQIEAGEQYNELRGVMLECEAKLHRDVDFVAALGVEILTRYAPSGDDVPAEAIRELVRRQAAKRVAIEFVERTRASWDHRKLAGGY